MKLPPEKGHAMDCRKEPRGRSGGSMDAHSAMLWAFHTIAGCGRSLHSLSLQVQSKEIGISRAHEAETGDRQGQQGVRQHCCKAKV